jgi:Tail tubular protein
MASPTIMLTALDAVNQMLASIGQAPLNTLSVSGITDASIAKLALDNTTREVQMNAWSFNTDYDYSLVPDVAGHILIPASALDVIPEDATKNYVERYNTLTSTRMLYDTVNNTFTITDSPLKVSITWGFDFEQLPAVFRHYIATRASRIFQSQVIGSDILFKYTSQHEIEAFAFVKKHESRYKRRNIFSSTSSANDIINRNRVPHQGF